MPKLITRPTIIKAAGNKAKLIQEFIGRVNSATTEISIARMKSPPGWLEPSQTPRFNEYTFVLKGQMQVENNGKVYHINKNEVFIAYSGEKVRYSTPKGAEYIAVCLPAFSSETVNRE
jgi:mannose-6-phosphate isomerase-like protein (cupin superfamily)